MKKSFVLCILIFCFIGTVFTGCKGKVDSDKFGLKKVIVAELRGEYWLPVYLAQTLGFYKEEGLDVQFLKFKDGPIAFQGMHAGNAQFCLLSSEPVFRAYDQGKESKMVLSTLKGRAYVFVAKKEIKSIKDLKGKIIFAGMPGSAPYSFAQSLLINAGLDPVKDVTWANMEYAASLGALEKGSVDGVFLRSKGEAKRKGVTILADMTNPVQHKNIYGSDKFESTVVVATKDYVDKNPETVQKFVNGVVKAILWQSNNSDEAVAKMAAPLFEGMRIDAEFISYLRPSLSSTGDISMEGYKSQEKFCLKTKIISKPISYEKLIDTSFVRKAYKEFSK